MRYPIPSKKLERYHRIIGDTSSTYIFHDTSALDGISVSGRMLTLTQWNLDVPPRPVFDMNVSIGYSVP